MPIILDQFMGAFPQVDSRLLPDGASSFLRNCLIEDGKIRPMAIKGPYTSLNDGTDQIGELVSSDMTNGADLIMLTPSRAPIASERIDLAAGALSTSWVSFKVVMPWESIVPGFPAFDIGVAIKDCVIDSRRLTRNGIVYNITWPAPGRVVAYASVTTLHGTFQSWGPKLVATVFTGGLNGPRSSGTFPGGTPGKTSGTFSSFSLPVFDDQFGKIGEYGSFQLVSADIGDGGTSFGFTIHTSLDPFIFYGPSLSAGGGSVTFSLNYANPRPQRTYFLSSIVDSDDREGPPSEVSEPALKVEHGALPIDIALGPDVSKSLFYKSQTGYDDFMLVTEVDVSSVTGEDGLQFEITGATPGVTVILTMINPTLIVGGETEEAYCYNNTTGDWQFFNTGRLDHWERGDDLQEAPQIWVPLTEGDPGEYRTNIDWDNLSQARSGVDLYFWVVPDPLRDDDWVAAASPRPGQSIPLSGETISHLFFDTFPDHQNIPLPPYGSPPETAPDSGVLDLTFLKGSILHPANFGVGFSGKTLYLSDFYRLHVWPEENTVTFTENVEAIALSGTAIIVFTATRVYGIAGNDPFRMSRFLLSDSHALQSKRSICRFGTDVYYAGSDGIVQVNGSGIVTITGKIISQDQWRDFLADGGPVGDETDTQARTIDGKLIFFHELSGNSVLANAIILDVSNLDRGVLNFSGTSAELAYAAGAGGRIGYTAGGDLNPNWFKWHSKVFTFDEETTFDYVRLRVAGAVNTPIRLSISVDGAAANGRWISIGTPNAFAVITNDDMIDLSAWTLPFGKEWEFRMETDHNGSGVHLSPEDDFSLLQFEAYERQYLAIENNGFIMRAGRDPLWLNKRLEFPDMGGFRSGRVVTEGESGTYPLTLKLTPDGGATTEITVTSDQDFLVPGTAGYGRSWKVEIVGDHSIRELHLIGRESHPISSGTVRIKRGRGPFSWIGLTLEADRPVSFSTLRVMASAYTSGGGVTDLTVTLYAAGDASPTGSYTIANSDPIRIPRLRPEKNWRIDVIEPTGAIVQEVALSTSMEGLADGR